MRAQQARPPPSLRSTRTAGLPALGCWRWLRSIQLCLRWLAPTLLAAGAALTITSLPPASVSLAARSQYYEPTIAKRLARDVMRVLENDMAYTTRLGEPLQARELNLTLRRQSP